MSILRWDKPAKAMPTETWAEISADGAPPGVYTSNMSREDAEAWRASLSGTRKGDPCITIKTSCTRVSSVIRVYRDRIDYSQNGTANMSLEVWEQFKLAVQEAQERLASLESAND